MNQNLRKKKTRSGRGTPAPRQPAARAKVKRIASGVPNPAMRQSKPPESTFGWLERCAAAGAKFLAAWARLLTSLGKVLLAVALILGLFGYPIAPAQPK